MGKGGLAFLCKKTWHTSTIQNMEQVWLAEQKAAGEKKRIAELQKQIQEEREVAELRQLQEDAGLIEKDNGQRSLGWMYNAPMSSTSSEEYLLGKAFKEDEKAPQDVSKLEEKDVVGSTFLEKDRDNAMRHVLEKEAKLRDDPLMAFLKAEQMQRINVLKNPLQMKRIKEEAKLKKFLKKQRKRDRKKEKKEAKKLKKMHKKLAEEGNGEQEGSDPKTLDRTKRLSRSRSPGRRQRRSRSRSHSRRKRHHRRSRSRSRNRSESRSRSRSGERSKPKGGLVVSDKFSKYGLVHPKGVESVALQRNSRNGSTSNGTTYDRKRNEAPNYRLKYNPPPKQRNMGRMTEEEKRTRLASMRDDAEQNDDLRFKKLRKVQDRIAKEKKEFLEEMRETHGHAEEHTADFIKDLQKSSFLGTEDDLEDRIARNKHYRQRGSTEQHKFLER